MTSVFTWRDGKTHAPCVVLENVLHKEGRENVIKELANKVSNNCNKYFRNNVLEQDFA